MVTDHCSVSFQKPEEFVWLYLFIHLAVQHLPLVDPLPHQITAVYGEMVPRLPLRYLLADDPGSGKTIMAGLPEDVIARGDVQKCLIVCPGPCRSVAG